MLRRWALPVALAALLAGAWAPQCAAQAEPGARSSLRQLLRFQILEIRIEGNTLVPPDALEAALRPHLGADRSIADLDAARSAVLEAYRKAGHELLSVDYQAARSRNGIHYFAVREIRIGRVRVTGTGALTEQQVRRELPGLKEDETPKLSQMARELFLFNDNPGRSAVLDYSAGAPGITDVEVKVREQPQRRGTIALNNTGTSSTGELRAAFIWNEYNLFGRSHQITASLTTAPDKPGNVFVAWANYLIPLPSMGDTVSFGAAYSDVDSGRVADLFNVRGKGSFWNARYSRNLARSAESRHALDFGYDERRYQDVNDFFGTNLGVDVTAKPVSLTYRFSANSARDGVLANLMLQQNIPGGARNDDATYGSSRVGANASWRSWQGDFAWQHDLASGWSPALRAAGQYANEPLIAAEQFGLGGMRAVRGFAEREAAGDRGWRTSLELYGPRFFEGQRLLGFVDFGHSSRLNAQPGEQAAEGVASFGFGWRAQFANGIQAAVDAVKVTDGTIQHPRGTRSLHFAAAWSF